MTIGHLIEKLKNRQPTIEKAMLTQRDEWLNALQQLFEKIETWLAPAVDEGVLKISRGEEDFEESDFGHYQAQVLRIEDARASVRLQPVTGRVVGMVSGGHRLTGLRGRVDLICGPIKVPVVHTLDGEWKALPLRGAPRVLTQDTFVEILSEILLDE